MTAFARTMRGAVLMPLLILLAACVTAGPPPAHVLALTEKANRGDVGAQLQLAQFYDGGRWANGTEAEKWYRRAAEAGNAEAQNGLGSAMQAEERYGEARLWYEKAAAQNHTLAINNLGHLYDEGLGVPQDRRRGFELYTRAADLGEPEAMWNMAVMYDQGQLGQKDGIMACVWANRAFKYAKPGDRVLPVVNRALSILNKRMPVDQLRQCSEKVPEWQPSMATG